MWMDAVPAALQQHTIRCYYPILQMRNEGTENRQLAQDYIVINLEQSGTKTVVLVPALETSGLFHYPLILPPSIVCSLLHSPTSPDFLLLSSSLSQTLEWPFSLSQSPHITPNLEFKSGHIKTIKTRNKVNVNSYTNRENLCYIDTTEY